MRLDLYLVKQGYFASRTKAREAIDNGRVKVNGKLAKASFPVLGTEEIILEVDANGYVSRGGFKLEHALEVFSLNVTELRALDIGASTGGFTDCLLKKGVQEVVALDVGKDQLAKTLKTDPRVISLEKTNIRTLSPLKIGQFEIITIDVSFISLDKFLHRLPLFMKPEAEIVALIKPQFEAGKNKVDKHGVIKDPHIHLEVLHKVVRQALQAGLYTWDLTYSPILGGSGNLEFFGRFNLHKNAPPSEGIFITLLEEAYKKVMEK